MENDWVAPAAAAALALTGLIGIAWRSRAYALKRWLTAWDAYADREIARERGRTLKAAGRVGRQSENPIILEAMKKAANR